MNRKRRQVDTHSAECQRACLVGQGRPRAGLVFVCVETPRKPPRQDVTATIPHHLFAPRETRELPHGLAFHRARTWNEECRPRGACFITSAHAAHAATAVLPEHPRVLHLHSRTLDSHLQVFLLRSAPDRRPSSTPDLPAILQEVPPKTPEMPRGLIWMEPRISLFFSLSRRGGDRETKSCASPETRPR